MGFPFGRCRDCNCHDALGMGREAVTRFGVGRPPIDPQERFWAKVAKTSTCWLWTGTLVNGYGQFRLPTTKLQAHRYAYESMVGPVGAGLQLDHLCRNRACVRPEHLEPVSSKINTWRGEGPAGINARTLVCPKGHSYVPENTRLYRGKRHCRACDRDRSRRRRAA